MIDSSAYRVDTTSRLAQWRIDNLGSCTYRKSDPFKLGPWNWYLSVEKNKILYVRLYPETSAFARERPPIASFVVRVVSSAAGGRKTLAHPEVTDKPLKSSEDFIWPIDIPLKGKLIIDVEFLDLKTLSPEHVGSYSIWAEGLVQTASNETALSTLARMLKEGIHTDITINASNGSIGAHRAVLASRSPVFRSMFSYDLKEKEQSAVNIPDISIEACETFLNYIYGTARHEDFLTHRLALLRAADKYDVSDLKAVCHESLLEDIDSANVLERLQIAWLFELHELKAGCMTYLVKFGKVFDIRDEFAAFVQTADRELVTGIFMEVMNAWRGF